MKLTRDEISKLIELTTDERIRACHHYNKCIETDPTRTDSYKVCRTDSSRRMNLIIQKLEEIRDQLPKNF